MNDAELVKPANGISMPATDLPMLKKTARVAGLWYVLCAIIAPIALLYIPGKLIVKGDATETAHRILASEMLFRIGIASYLVGTVLGIFVVLALYRLFKGVNQQQALLMVIFSLVQVPITFINELNQFAALALIRGGNFMSVLDKPQRDSLAMLCLHLYEQGYVVAEIFWGLWLLPMGLLVIRSGFIPRILGWWLLGNGFAYLLLSFTGMLWPQYQPTVWKFGQPFFFGEVAFMLWLVIVGVRPKRLSPPTLVNAAC